MFPLAIKASEIYSSVPPVALAVSVLAGGGRASGSPACYRIVPCRAGNPARRPMAPRADGPPRCNTAAAGEQPRRGLRSRGARVVPRLICHGRYRSVRPQSRRYTRRAVPLNKASFSSAEAPAAIRLKAFQSVAQPTPIFSTGKLLSNMQRSAPKRSMQVVM